MGTLKVSSKDSVPRTCRLPQETRGAVGLGLGTTSLTLDVVWGCAQERSAGSRWMRGEGQPRSGPGLRCLRLLLQPGARRQLQEW